MLEEIPKVRKELGYLPLVTPTSQIVGTQSVINVLMGERYKTITKETAGVLRGEYGKTPALVDTELQQRVLEGSEPITCRPADKLEPELEHLTTEVTTQAKAQNIPLSGSAIDDVLTIALFPQVGWKFLENRNNPDAFEPAPCNEVARATTKAKTKSKPEKQTINATSESGVYTITVNNQSYVVQVDAGGDIQAVSEPKSAPSKPVTTAQDAEPMNAPLAGNIWKIHTKPGDEVEEGDVLLILEAMKMETEVRAPRSGKITSIDVSEGDAVDVGEPLLQLA